MLWLAVVKNETYCYNNIGIICICKKPPMFVISFIIMQVDAHFQNILYSNAHF